MDENDSAIDEALRALGSHPSLEDLRARLEGRLPREKSERVEAHIGRCPSCAEWAEDLEAFLGPPREPGPGEPAVDATQVWREVAKALGRSRPTEPEKKKPDPPPPIARFQKISFLQSLATVLLVATVFSFGAWLAAQRQISRLESGEVNVPILAIDQGLRREAEAGTEQRPVEAPPGAVLILTPPIEPKPLDYEVRISTLNGHPGRIVWSEQGLRPTPEGSFHLQLPRDLQTGESYRIQILPGEEELTIRAVTPRRE